MFKLINLKCFSSHCAFSRFQTAKAISWHDVDIHVWCPFRSFYFNRYFLAKLNSESYDSMQSGWWFALQFNQKQKNQSKIMNNFIPAQCFTVAFPFQVIDRFPYMATRAHIHFRALLYYIYDVVEHEFHIGEQSKNMQKHVSMAHTEYTSMNYWTSTRFSWLL